MSARARLYPTPLAAVVAALLLTACLPLPVTSPTPTPSPSPTPSPTADISGTPEPTPLPYSLDPPLNRDKREIQVTVAPNLPTDGSGQIVVTITNLDVTRIAEIVLRWPTALDEHLLLAPFVPSNERICDTCPPLHQEWTKWVVGPGERGEPAGTTSLGWGPLDPGATLVIPVIANRRQTGPVEFDLQLLAGEALLRQDTGQPAWIRVFVP